MNSFNEYPLCISHRNKPLPLTTDKHTFKVFTIFFGAITCQNDIRHLPKSMHHQFLITYISSRSFLQSGSVQVTDSATGSLI